MNGSALDRAKISRGISGDDRYELALHQLGETVVKSRTILDVGCGAGYFGNFLRTNIGYAGELVGTDIHLYDNLSRETYQDWHSWNLNDSSGAPDRKFDVIFIVEALHCTESPRQVVRSLVRLLEPKGLLVFVTANPLSIISVATLATRGMFRDFQEHPDGWRYPTQLTPILPIDALRIFGELEMEEASIRFSNRLRLPGGAVPVQRYVPFLKGRWFSDCYRASARKPA